MVMVSMTESEVVEIISILKISGNSNTKGLLKHLKGLVKWFKMYKIRTFYKERITLREKGSSAMGKIDITNGNEEFVIKEIKQKLNKARRIIIDVI